MDMNELMEKEKAKYEFVYGSHKKYGLHSTRYDWFRDLNKKFIIETRQIIQQASSILDVGCGKGGFIKFFVNEYKVPLKKFYGIDISAQALEECPKPVTTKEASIHEIPYEDDRFDCVLHFDGMEHIPQEIERAALNEMMRVSKKYVILTLHMGGCIEDKMMLKNGYDHLHINVKGFDEWKKLIQTACTANGFEVHFIERFKNHIRAILKRA